jgi:hypothetical protein
LRVEGLDRRNTSGGRTLTHLRVMRAILEQLHMHLISG